MARYENDEESVWGVVVDIVTLAVLLGCGVLAATRFLSWSNASFVILGQSAFPLAMLPVWFALAVTVWKAQPLRTVAATVLCVVHLAAMRPAWGSDPTPKWTTGESVASLRLLSANIFLRNADPQLGESIAGLNPDVIVFAEFGPENEVRLRNEGVFETLPFSVSDGPNSTNLTLYSRFPFASAPRTIPVPTDGSNKVLIVDIDLGPQIVRVVGVHPPPGLGSDHPAFLQTMRVLREEVRQSPHPIVLAGDFNGSRWVPAVGELLGAGLTSSHEALGYGLSASWPEGVVIPPFMRLDHVLYGDGIAAVKLADVVLKGSDHRGIVVDLKVR
jgi:endonuclease/exonuclease/phosphatase (EEP) superfamily protein YafD